MQHMLMVTLASVIFLRIATSQSGAKILSALKINLEEYISSWELEVDGKNTVLQWKSEKNWPAFNICPAPGSNLNGSRCWEWARCKELSREKTEKHWWSWWFFFLIISFLFLLCIQLIRLTVGAPKGTPLPALVQQLKISDEVIWRTLLYLHSGKLQTWHCLPVFNFESDMTKGEFHCHFFSG